MRKFLPVAVATVALVTALSACGPQYPPGPHGTVTDRSATYFKSGGWRYRLTVTTPDGRRETFRVARHDYGNCFHRSAYPTCTHR
ncbi:hypothetical protein ACIQI8_28640 [Streptomyces sp. NPDC092369]|uniref:hypothetical protein n=1 Tax=Streptomyces sp. NPDC092369 TaxID=3366015 RepID=UPI0037F8AB36